MVVFDGVEQAGNLTSKMSILPKMHEGITDTKENGTNEGFYCPNERFFLPVE